jgi:hypothetical protein
MTAPWVERLSEREGAPRGSCALRVPGVAAASAGGSAVGKHHRRGKRRGQRLRAAGAGSDPVCGAVGAGHIPGPQVQRLRSSELAGRNSTSPNASPRPAGDSPRGGAGKSFDSGPPEKVARRSPGGSLSVDVENGAGGSPMPSPAAGLVCVRRRSVYAMESTCRKHRHCAECNKLVRCCVTLGCSVSAGLASLLTLLAANIPPCRFAGGWGRDWQKMGDDNQQVGPRSRAALCIMLASCPLQQWWRRQVPGCRCGNAMFVQR